MTTSCCQDLQSELSFQQWPGADPAICGDSVWPGQQCLQSTSWDNARASCEAVGARLCSVRDIFRGEVMNTGCGANALLTWTHESCITEEGKAGFMALLGSGGDRGVCLDAFADDAAMRCCADACLENYAYFTGYGCKDPDLRAIRATTRNACEDACTASRECFAYTFNTNDGDCFLKNTCEEFQLEPSDFTGAKVGFPGRDLPQLPGDSEAGSALVGGWTWEDGQVKDHDQASPLNQRNSNVKVIQAAATQ
eukprot:scaffold123014_cov34-Prasinocladus_malaysianus.AAC.1